MIMKDVQSNGDNKKTNQQRHRHTTVKRLSIKKSPRDKKLTFKFKVKKLRQGVRWRLRRGLSPQLCQHRLNRLKLEQVTTIKELMRDVEVGNCMR